MKSGEPIDLDALRALIADPAKDRVTIGRGLVDRVIEELAAAREASVTLGRVFGLPGQSL